MPGVWVFGYGSLVSPDSFGSTVGRILRPGHDFFPAELSGYGRRWNYGVMHMSAELTGPSDGPAERTIIALGVVASVAEAVNGVIGWVGEAEISELDRRERHYDRVDITGRVTVDTPSGMMVDGAIVTYVPRPESIRHYERERDAGRAAIELRYWRLVDDAFAALGEGQHRRYREMTPPPDVPVLEMFRRER